MRGANTSILESHNSVWKHWQGLSAQMSQPRWMCLVRHLAWMNNEEFIRRAKKNPPTPRFRAFLFDGTKVSIPKHYCNVSAREWSRPANASVIPRDYSHSVLRKMIPGARVHWSRS